VGLLGKMVMVDRDVLPEEKDTARRYRKGYSMEKHINTIKILFTQSNALSPRDTLIFIVFPLP
jgi:hypothetical protein